MYTLRIIEPNGSIRNQLLGNTYETVQKDSSEKLFNSVFCEYFNVKDHDKARDDEGYESIVSFVISGFIYPIELGQKAFIMMENGKTFEKIN